MRRGLTRYGDEAFSLYGRALRLRPEFPEAREYVGEAHIDAALERFALSHIADAPTLTRQSTRYSPLAGTVIVTFGSVLPMNFKCSLGMSKLTVACLALDK